MEQIFLSHKGEVAALLTAVCWTFTSLAFESAGKKVGSMSVNLIRLVMAIFLLGSLSFIRFGYFFPEGATTSQWVWLSISGLVGFVVGDLLLFQAFVVIGARISMLIMALAPPLAALFGWIILGEQLTLGNILGMVVTIFGISLVILGRPVKGKRIQIKYSVKGILLAFGGATGQGLGLVLSKLGMGDYDPVPATMIRVITGVIGFSFIFIFTGHWPKVIKAVRYGAAMARISIGAFFGPFLGVSLSLWAIKYTTTGVASTIMAIVPVLIIAPAVVLFKEKVTIMEIIGSFIAVAGVVMLFVW
ncbi:DMT family transporter [Carboxylicivirga linearis]|uniref:DMT family transporter n=1 Tax=Carboxylicivirga linearis TaxID=1628157 RepID=A0ABS5JS30_9BACT|nr:DMT family transporter [Carboxylicivirga linearis]MBS2097652.1 DMT family transporter [Carboxylicivirga linearis]